MSVTCLQVNSQAPSSYLSLFKIFHMCRSLAKLSCLQQLFWKLQLQLGRHCCIPHQHPRSSRYQYLPPSFFSPRPPSIWRSCVHHRRNTPSSCNPLTVSRIPKSTCGYLQAYNHQHSHRLSMSSLSPQSTRLRREHPACSCMVSLGLRIRGNLQACH